MYINLQLLQSRQINLEELGLLQAIKQNRTEDNSEYLRQHLSEQQIRRFEELSLLEYTKTGKDIFKRLRTSKKGNTWLQDFESYGVLEQDAVVYNWMKDLYLQLGKEIGSEKKCKQLIAWFRTESNISKNSLIHLLRTFVSDEDRMEFSKVLQFVFWVPAHRYQKDPALEDSKLWLYYEKYKEKFDEDFKKYE